MSRITTVSDASANTEQRSLLDAIQSQLGMVPNFLRVFAHSPDALQAFLLGKASRVDIDFPKVALKQAA